MTTRRHTGDAGEDRAATVLERRGFVILARNWSCRYGELDLITRLGTTIVFVEVRVRRTSTASARGSIGSRKIARLIASAQHYLQVNECDEMDWRIDVVTISGDQLEHLPFAIEGTD